MHLCDSIHCMMNPWTKTTFCGLYHFNKNDLTTKDVMLLIPLKSTPWLQHTHIVIQASWAHVLPLSLCTAEKWVRAHIIIESAACSSGRDGRMTRARCAAHKVEGAAGAGEWQSSGGPQPESECRALICGRLSEAQTYPHLISEEHEKYLHATLVRKCAWRATTASSAALRAR